MCVKSIGLIRVTGGAPEGRRTPRQYSMWMMWTPCRAGAPLWVWASRPTPCTSYKGRPTQKNSGSPQEGGTTISISEWPARPGTCLTSASSPVLIALTQALNGWPPQSRTLSNSTSLAPTGSHTRCPMSARRTLPPMTSTTGRGWANTTSTEGPTPRRRRGL